MLLNAPTRPFSKVYAQVVRIPIVFTVAQANEGHTLCCLPVLSRIRTVFLSFFERELGRKLFGTTSNTGNIHAIDLI